MNYRSLARIGFLEALLAMPVSAIGSNSVPQPTAHPRTRNVIPQELQREIQSLQDEVAKLKARKTKLTNEF